MKKILTMVLLICSSISVLAQSALQTNSIIVSFKAEMLPANISNKKVIKNFGVENADRLNSQYGATCIRKIPTGQQSGKHLYTIDFAVSQDSETIIDAYLQTGLFEYVEPNYGATGGGTKATIPTDQHFNKQWGLHNNGTFSLSPATAGADVDMTNAWDVEQGDPNQVICIIDSGCKMDHPEFVGRIWVNTGEIANNNLDDANGFTDDVNGWDFINQDNNPTDDHGHGTNVAGIAAATGNNSNGYAGINWRCKVMILKALNNQNSGSYAAMAAAIYYAVNKGAKVINMSIGGSAASQTLQDAVTFANTNNVVFVACMMNTNTSIPFYPAAYSSVIAVGSTNPNDTRTAPFFWGTTSGSCFGSHISVVAPGNYIYGLQYQSNTNYNTYWGGTSQASPLVAGLASLLLAQDPTRTPAQIKQIIEATAEDQVGSPLEDISGWDQYYGHGRVNANAALRYSFLGTSEVVRSNGPDFNIFPNPSNGTVFISANNKPGPQDEVTVTNILGQVIAKKKLLQPNELINLPKPGIYLITTRHQQNQKTTKVVVN